MKYRTKAVDFRLNSFGISLIFAYEKRYLFKIQCCSTSSAKISSKFTDKVPFLADLSVTEGAFYGQILRIAILPVIEDQFLRANLKNRLFARNRELPFTGKSQESAFCP